VIHIRLVRFCFCLTLLALPALALGGPSGQSGAATPQNSDCLYLPMVSAGGQAAANLSVAQAASPCDGLAAAPEPSPTSGSTATASVTSAPTATATAIATGAATATSTAPVISSATATRTATNTATPTATRTSTPTVTRTPTNTATKTVTASNTPTSSVTATRTATNTATPTATPTATHMATATATNTATSTSSPTASATATSTAEPGLISGTLRLRPEQPLISAQTRPRRVIAVLDVSGSMSANFNGQCNNTGVLYQCSNGPAGYPAVQVTGTGDRHWWIPVEERRIYVAKQAIQRLIGQLNMPGNPSYDASRPPDELALVWFNNQQTSSMTYGWSTNPLSLTEALLNVSKVDDDPYRSAGGTNIPAGLYRASLLLNASPASVEFAGQLYPYDFSVVYMSDGIANQFLDVTKHNLAGGGSDAGTYAAGNACRTTVNLAESAACMTTEVGGLHITKGWDRPFTQAHKVAQELHARATVYGMAISPLPSSYHAPIASSPAQFYAIPSYSRNAEGDTTLDLAIDQVVAASQLSSCQASVGPWVATIDAAHSPDEPSLPLESFGSVRIYNAQSELLDIAQVRLDEQGRLRYAFNDAQPPGSYSLRGTLYYKGDDGVTRAYSRFDSGGPLAPTLAIELTSGPQAVDLWLRVAEDVCAE
jgi:hypothetical protein